MAKINPDNTSLQEYCPKTSLAWIENTSFKHIFTVLPCIWSPKNYQPWKIWSATMIVGEWKYHKTTAVYQNLNKRNINTNTILSGKKINHGLKRCKTIEK